MTYFIGIDPDLHTTAIAVADLEEVCWVGVARINSRLTGHAAVEAMSEKIHETFWTEGGADVCCLICNRKDTSLHLTVESQRVYQRHDKANPNSLLLLAQVAGSALFSVGMECESAHLVYPQDWKGGVFKYIDQGRTYTHFGWDYRIHDKPKDKKDWYGIPTQAKFNVKDSDWKHLGDALGIALWAAKEDARRQRIEKRRA